jgi:hypothetical protein
MHDSKYNALDIIQHIVVPKTDNLVTKRLQICGSLSVVFFLLQMLASAQFDDEFGFGGAHRPGGRCQGKSGM